MNKVNGTLCKRVDQRGEMKRYSLTSSRNSSLSFFIYASLIQFFCPYVFAIRFLNLQVKLCGMHESPCDKRGKIATRVEIQFEHHCSQFEHHFLNLFSNEKLASFNSNTIVQFEHHSHQTMLNALT